ncbi:FAD-dependent monooxygenase [Aquamicrobium sp. LC103]|uniref:FAD-dependent monooxygenase n=1 Tax=Aquamicrobium sp. LC103 TaxID=1120658 RepID=UPI00063EA820|nr:FAD-dependent monooxygenase [Aquamicrobium sp. LC103]TKT81394.1 salicylate hydroxylase [Aquamicrobium sp. LC103]
MARGAGPVAIAGAGIAGLTAALAFSAGKIPSRIFERAPRFEEVGAGIQLSPNATRILRRLGALDRLLAHAVKPKSIDIRDAGTLKRLARVPLGEAGERRWGAPYLVIHRSDLQDALVQLVAERTDIELTADARVTGIDPITDGARLSVTRAGGAEDFPCRFAVGADGVWSTLRDLAGRPGTSRYTGYLAWRATIDADASAVKILGEAMPSDRVTTFLSPRFHLVAYPVRGGREINLVAVTRGAGLSREWSNLADPSLLNSTLKRAAPRLRELVGAAPSWRAWPIHAVASDCPWTFESRLVLIGDAAHAMSPYAAQGAAMAIEDADVLAQMAAESADTAEVFARYEAARRERVRRVAARGAFNRFAWHAAGPFALGRNLVLSLRGPERLAGDLDWLYGWSFEARSARSSG